MNQVELAFERMAKLRNSAKKFSAAIDECGFDGHKKSVMHNRISEILAIALTSPPALRTLPADETAISPVAAAEAVAEAVEKIESIKNG